MTPDQSAEVLTVTLRAQQPFVFTKMGDAEIEWVFRIGECIAEGDIGTPEYGKALLDGWLKIGRAHRLFVGDWLTASFAGPDDPVRYPAHCAALYAMLENKATFLHYEALLVMRRSDALLDFYRALKEDKRRKVFVGPERLAAAAEMLGARHVVVPLEGACAARHQLMFLLKPSQFDVALFCAGRLSKMLMGAVCEFQGMNHTLIDIGSAFDPVFAERTRSQQLPEEIARKFFAPLL